MGGERGTLSGADRDGAEGGHVPGPVAPGRGSFIGSRQHGLTRAAAAVAAAAYLAPYLWTPRRYGLLDHVDLAIHEAGHLLFAPFGEFVGIAGGTLLQLIIPMAFVAHFARRGERFAAAMVLFWVAQSLFNVATYMADARAQLLPLVGGPHVIHDWEWMFSRLRLLDQDRVVAGVVRALAALVWFFATVGSLSLALRRDPEPG